MAPALVIHQFFAAYVTSHYLHLLVLRDSAHPQESHRVLSTSEVRQIVYRILQPLVVDFPVSSNIDASHSGTLANVGIPPVSSGSAGFALGLTRG